MASELILQKKYLDEEVLETIYLGGGTPSLLTDDELQLLLHTIYQHYAVAERVEITLEANPDDLTKQKLLDLRKAGVNRLSLGIQSFDTNILRFLNRAHNSEEAARCISLAREVGFDNLSIDLIHSIPGQDQSLLEKNIKQALSFKPEHISAYSLTVEDKTVFGHWAKQGRFTPMEETHSEFQFEWVMDTLVTNGYVHYEISNFCLPGFVSKHNTSYWQQKKYLGVGPSAHSFNGNSRQFNIHNNHQYMQALREGRLPFEREVLTRANKINEYIFTTLRTHEGCNLSYLHSHHQHDLVTHHADYIKSLLSDNRATLVNQTLVLTRSGKLVADQIASDLFISPE